MADAFLPSPRIEPTPRSVGVVLCNTTTLGEDDRAFISRIGAEDLSDEEYRALLQAHNGGEQSFRSPPRADAEGRHAGAPIPRDANPSGAGLSHGLHAGQSRPAADIEKPSWRR